MPKIIKRVPLSKEQDDYINALGVENLAKIFRDGIRAMYPDFPMDKEVGVRDDYTKINLLNSISGLFMPHLPMGAETLHNIVMSYLVDNNTSSFTREALIILHTQGIESLLGWFGTPPVYSDEHKNVIMGIRIKSIDED